MRISISVALIARNQCKGACKRVREQVGFSGDSTIKKQSKLPLIPHINTTAVQISISDTLITRNQWGSRYTNPGNYIHYQGTHYTQGRAEG